MFALVIPLSRCFAADAKRSCTGCLLPTKIILNFLAEIYDIFKTIYFEYGRVLRTRADTNCARNSTITGTRLEIFSFHIGDGRGG